MNIAFSIIVEIAVYWWCMYCVLYTFC